MRRARGFSLIEVLVAFAFVALVGTALYRVFSGALRNAVVAEDYTRAVLLAESRMAALGIGATLVPGSESGEVENDKYRWATTIRPFQAPAPAGPEPGGPNAAPIFKLGAKLLEVEVSVSWPSAGDTRAQVVLHSLRLAPEE